MNAQNKKLVMFDFFGTLSNIQAESFNHEVLKNSVVQLAGNYALAVVSSSSESNIKDFLSKENILSYFSDICGAGLLDDKVSQMKKLLEKYSLLAENSIYVTDTLGDVEEAAECGVKSVAVTWGFHDRQTLEKGSPAAIIDDPRDLVRAVENVLK